MAPWPYCEEIGSALLARSLVTLSGHGDAYVSTRPASLRLLIVPVGLHVFLLSFKIKYGLK